MILDKEKYKKCLDACMHTEKPLELSEEQRELYRNKIKKLLKEKNAAIIAHYYVDADIQQLADETGGIVADSLDMAKFGAECKAETLVVAGVRFMGETAKILSPSKRVLMPTTLATCSLDEGCDPKEFAEFCKENPGRTVVVYANTSAAIKALADWVVTSSIAIDVAKYLIDKGEKIIWAPDRFLGNYIKNKTGADMLIWDAACIVHEGFAADKIAALKKEHPNAIVLVHPESPAEVVALADVVGSTTQLLQASINMPNNEFIVATESGILYKMQKASPNKKFFVAPTGREGALYDLCGVCPWMKMNNLKNLSEVLESEQNEIKLPADVIAKALIPLERMVNFKK
jgi:quinolinate synthase